MKAMCCWCGRTVNLTGRGHFTDHRRTLSPLSGPCPTAGMRPDELLFVEPVQRVGESLPHRAESRHGEFKTRASAHVRTMMGERR